MNNNQTSRRGFLRGLSYLLAGGIGYGLGYLTPKLNEMEDVSNSKELEIVETDSVMIIPKVQTDWKNITDKSYLKKVAKLSHKIKSTSDQLVFSKYIDVERMHRGLMVLQITGSHGDITEYLDFENEGEGFLVNFKSWKQGFFAYKGGRYDEGRIDAIVNFPYKNFRGESREARDAFLVSPEGVGWKETYQKGTQIYINTILHMTSYFWNKEAIKHWNVETYEEAAESEGRLFSKRF